LRLLSNSFVVAFLYVKSQVYSAVVRLELPGDLKIAGVLPETKERKACGDSNDRFLAPFKQSCKECKIAMARCERQLEGLDLAIREGTQATYPMVIASEARLVVMGPPQKAKAGCQFLATSMVARGLRTAVCVEPAA